MQDKVNNLISNFNIKKNNIIIPMIIYVTMLILLYTYNKNENRIYELIIIATGLIYSIYMIFLSFCLFLIGIILQLFSKKIKSDTEKQKNNKAMVFISALKVIGSMFYINYTIFLTKTAIALFYSICLYYSEMTKIATIQISSILLHLICAFWLKGIVNISINYLEKNEYSLLENTIKTIHLKSKL